MVDELETIIKEQLPKRQERKEAIYSALAEIFNPLIEDLNNKNLSATVKKLLLVPETKPFNLETMVSNLKSTEWYKKTREEDMLKSDVFWEEEAQTKNIGYILDEMIGLNPALVESLTGLPFFYIKNDLQIEPNCQTRAHFFLANKGYTTNNDDLWTVWWITKTREKEILSHALKQLIEGKRIVGDPYFKIPYTPGFELSTLMTYTPGFELSTLMTKVAMITSQRNPKVVEEKLEKCDAWLVNLPTFHGFFQDREQLIDRIRGTLLSLDENVHIAVSKREGELLFFYDYPELVDLYDKKIGLRPTEGIWLSAVASFVYLMKEYIASTYLFLRLDQTTWLNILSWLDEIRESVTNEEAKNSRIVLTPILTMCWTAWEIADGRGWQELKEYARKKYVELFGLLREKSVDDLPIKLWYPLAQILAKPQFIEKNARSAIDDLLQQKGIYEKVEKLWGLDDLVESIKRK